MGLMVKCLPCRHLGLILAKHDQTRAYHAQTGGPSKLFLFVSPPHKSIGCGSGMTCWRRLRDWQQDGIWDFIHFALRMTSYTEVGGHSDLGFRFADNTSRKCAHFDWIPRVRCWR